MEIKEALKRMEFRDGATLGIKVGLGVGKISILHVGGTFQRMEYVATGDPLRQAFTAEHNCEESQVQFSPQVWQRVKNYFVEDTDSGRSADGYVYVQGMNKKEMLPKKGIFKTMGVPR